MTKSATPGSLKLVTLGDVAVRVMEKHEASPDLPEPWVGADHLDEGDLRIKRWSMSDDPVFPPTFKFKYPIGAVLIHSRNPKKVAIAEFAAITGEKIFALSSRDESILSSRFLAYVLQSARFENFTDEWMTGSVNKFLNWSALEKFKFPLPQIAEQDRMVSLMEKCAKVVSNYESVVPILQNLKTSLWVEMIASSDESQVCNLGSLISLEYGKALKEADRVEGDVPVYGSAGMVGSHNKNLAAARRNIVVGRKGSAGSISVVESPCWVIDTAYFVVVKDEGLEFDFVKELLVQSKLSELNTQTAVPGLNREEVYRKNVVLPNSATRSEYLAKFEKINSLIAILDGHLKEAESVQAVLREHGLLAGQNV